MAYEAFQIAKQELEPKKRAAGTWVDDSDLPPVGVKVSASARGPATGVQHKKCPAKQWREQFHNKRNRLKKMDEAWANGDYVSNKAWRALKSEVEELRIRSDEASWAKGEPFTDSQGIRRNETPFEEASIVARAIALYAMRTPQEPQ